MTEDEKSFNLVVVTDVATVTSNLDELREFVSHAIEPYVGVSVSEEEVGYAKKDLAKLRKLKEQIEAERKRVKKEINAPYLELEAKVKEITASIDKAIDGIDGQVKAFEAEEKARRTEAVNELWTSLADELGGDDAGLASLPCVWTWTSLPSWTNKSTSMKEVESQMRDRLKTFFDVIQYLRSSEDRYTSVRIDEYCQTGVLSSAVLKADRLKAMDEAREKAFNDAMDNSPDDKPLRIRADREDQSTPWEDVGYRDVTFRIPVTDKEELTEMRVRIAIAKDKVAVLRQMLTALGAYVRPIEG